MTPECLVFSRPSNRRRARSPVPRAGPARPARSTETLAAGYTPRSRGRVRS